MAQGNRTHRRGHRKTLFRPEMMSEGYKLGALGLTLPEISDFWNIGERTLKRWTANKPEFEAQIKKGKSEADLTVIQSMLEQAKKGNMTAAIFWLKNRCGWKDAPLISQSFHNHFTYEWKDTNHRDRLFTPDLSERDSR